MLRSLLLAPLLLATPAVADRAPLEPPALAGETMPAVRARVHNLGPELAVTRSVRTERARVRLVAAAPDAAAGITVVRGIGVPADSGTGDEAISGLWQALANACGPADGQLPLAARLDY